MLKAIVFDFDGVIVDSEPLHHRAFNQLLRSAGVSIDYDTYLRDYVGFDDRDAVRAMLRGPMRRPDLAADDQRVRAMIREKGDAFERVVAQGVRAMPGSVELIRSAAAALPVAIASGATRRDIDLILGGLGVDHLFATIVTADLVHRSKPDPETYSLAVRQLADLHPDRTLTPADCLAIEDTAAGIESARAAGLHVLAVANTGPAASLGRAHRVVDSLGDVDLDRLHRWFG